MNNNKVKKMAGIAIFSAIIVALQLFSNYITFGPVSITLALAPIAIGAIIYGPFAGLFLGLIHGVMVIIAPSTLATFMPYSAIGTILVCLLKSGFAGLISGLLFKYLKKINTTLAIILASVIIPIVNTGLFAISCLTIFLPLLETFYKSSDSANIYSYLFLVFIGFNFIIEFVINSALSPTIIRLTSLHEKLKN